MFWKLSNFLKILLLTQSIKPQNKSQIVEEVQLFRTCQISTIKAPWYSKSRQFDPVPSLTVSILDYLPKSQSKSNYGAASVLSTDAACELS